jgi:hypothetical protein
MAAIPIARSTSTTKNGIATRDRMVIVSWNVNGLRAWQKKQKSGLAALFKEFDADVICLQVMHFSLTVLSLLHTLSGILIGNQSMWI